MLTEFKFHHIGVAVKDIDATAAIYEGAGYRMSDIVFDPIQNVSICWLTKEGAPIVELLAPVDETSPVCKTLEKNGVTPAVKQLRKEKYVLTSKPEPAAAFCGSKVCFLYNKNVGLIELVEAPANIID